MAIESGCFKPLEQSAQTTMLGKISGLTSPRTAPSKVVLDVHTMNLALRPARIKVNREMRWGR